MTATFDTALVGTTTTGTFVKCLAFHLPLAASNTSHTISVSLPSGVTVQSAAIPGGMGWASNALTIPSTFTDPFSRVELDLSNGSVVFVSVFLSGSPQNGVASSFQVNDLGWMSVTSAGQGVTFKGFTPQIEFIPEFGRVDVKDAIVFIPNVIGQDFTFRASSGTLATSDSDKASLSDSDTLATILGSNLAPGSTVTLTVTSSGSVTCSFLVQRLGISETTPSGSEIGVAVNSNDVLSVFSIDSGAFLHGNEINFNTEKEQDFDLLFTIVTDNFSFLSSPIIANPGSTFTSSTPETNQVLITDAGTHGTQTGFSIATNAGTWDPTIINNGDPDR